MKIACYALAYNEEMILPQFIDHYKKFCDKIVIYDNMSTDNTKQIALDNGCEVISWEAPGGGLNDQCYIEIKSQCYKQDREHFDWVMTVDSDELYTHKNGVGGLLSCLERYKKQGVTLPKIKGYNMVGPEKDCTDITKITKGVEDISYSKRCLFSPKLDMMWSWGCHPQHSAEFVKNVSGVVESEESDILLYHYKYINLDYVINRHAAYSKRMSSFNKERGLAVHYDYEEERVRSEYLDLKNKAVEVI